MAALTKSTTQLFALQTLADNASVQGELDMSTKLEGVVSMRMGRNNGSSFTTNGIKFLVEGSHDTSGNAKWFPIAAFETALGSSVVASAFSATANVNDTNLALTAPVTGFTPGELVFIKNTNGASSSEFARVVFNNSPNITVADGIATQQTAALSTVMDQAEEFSASIPAGVRRVRVLAINDTAQTAYVHAQISTADSIA